MLRLPLLPLAAALSLTAAAAQADSLDSLYAKAKQAGETQVVLYTPYGHLQSVFDAFAQAYPGIAVQPAVISGGGAPLVGRIAAEAASGNHAGDLVLSGMGDIATLTADGRLEPDTPDEAAALDPQYKDANGLFQVPFTTLFTLVYNTTLLKEEQLPKTLDEAVGKGWAGRFGYTRYTGAAAPDLVGATLAHNDAITDEQLKAIKANGQVAPTAAQLLTHVAQGRVAFGLWGPTQNVGNLQRDGAPIKVKYLADSAVTFGPGLSLLRKAPHPNAARLFKGWLLGTAGQTALTRASSYGTRAGAPVPPDLPALEGYRFTSIPLAQWEAQVKSFRARTQAIFD